MTKPLTHSEIIRKLLVRSTPKPTVTIEAMKDWTKITVTMPAATVEQAGARCEAEYDRLHFRYNAPDFVPDFDPEDVPFQ